MLAKEITSLQHPIVKHLVQLRQSRELRRSSKTALAVGKKMVADLAKSLPLIELFFTEENTDLPLHAETKYLVTTDILKKITGLQHPDGVAAVVPLPLEQDLSRKNYLLLLNGVQDPGNVGALFRSALGLGWEGIFLTPGTADPCNDKALRAAKGATFHLPFSYASEEEVILLTQEKKIPAYVACAGGKEVETLGFQPPLLLVLGSEGSGPSFTFLKTSTKIALPMAPSIESYNVAAAGSMLMYAMRKK